MRMHVFMTNNHSILTPYLTEPPPLPMAEMLRFCATAAWPHAQLDTERTHALYLQFQPFSDNFSRFSCLLTAPWYLGHTPVCVYNHICGGVMHIESRVGVSHRG